MIFCPKNHLYPSACTKLFFLFIQLVEPVFNITMIFSLIKIMFLFFFFRVANVYMTNMHVCTM